MRRVGILAERCTAERSAPVSAIAHASCCIMRAQAVVVLPIYQDTGVITGVIRDSRAVQV